VENNLHFPNDNDSQFAWKIIFGQLARDLKVSNVVDELLKDIFYKMKVATLISVPNYVKKFIWNLCH